MKMATAAKLLCFCIALTLTTAQSVEPFDAGIIFVGGDNDLPMIAANLAIENHLASDSKNSVFITARGKTPKYILDQLCNALNHTLGVLKKTPLVLDGTRTGVPSETVKAFTSALAIPTVATSFGQEGDTKAWLALDPDEEKYLIQISPPLDVVVEIVKALVAHQNLTNFALLHDEQYVMTHKAIDFTQNIPARSTIKLITSGDLLRHQLRELYAAEYRNFFIFGNTASNTEVLAMANELRYLTRANLYVGHMDKYALPCPDCDGSIFALFPKFDPELMEKMKDVFGGKVGDVADEISLSFYYNTFSKAILAASTLTKEGKLPPINSFVTCNQFSEEKLKQHPNLDLRTTMQQEIQPSLYGPLVIDSNGNSFMKFEMVLQRGTYASKKKPPSYVTIATWETGYSSPVRLVAGASLAVTNARPKYRVVTNEQAPFVMKNNNQALGPPFYGICIDLLDELAKRMGFEYFIYEVHDGKMGYIDDNGDWSGIVGELIEKNADIGIAAISIMAERERVIDFSIPYYDLVGISILMKKSQTPTSLFKFLTVLEADVWLCILAAYFITSFLMWVFDTWSPYSYQNNKEKYKDDEEKRIFNFKECLWFCMTSLTPQGGGEAPKNLSGRLVAATWWLFGFIIMASYTANLAAFLTVSRLDTPIESLDDLSKQYKIGYAPINGTAEMRYFQRMAEIENRFYEIWKDMSLNDSLSPYERSKLAVWDYPVSDKFTKMWQAMTETGLPNSLEEALVRVRNSRTSNEGFALLGDSTDNQYYGRTSCDLQVVGEEFSRKPYAVALQEGSSLRLPINGVLQELINEGWLNERKTYWWKNISNGISCENLNEEQDGISIKNIGGVFIVIVLGIGGALFALTLEYSWHDYQRRKAAKASTNRPEGWGNSPNYSEGGFRRQNRTEEGFSNRYLDPLNLYGDQVMRRTNIQRAFPW